MKIKKLDKEQLFTNVVSYIVSSILTLLLFALVFLISLKLGLLSQSALKKAIDHSAYGQNVYVETYTETWNMLRPTGLTMNDVVGDALKVDKFYENIDGYIQSVFDGKSFETDTKAYENQVLAQIKAYMIANDIEESAENLRGAQDLVKEVVRVYDEMIEFPYLNYIVEGIQFFERFVWYGIAGICFFILVCLVILFFTYHYKHKMLRFVNCSMIAADMMLIVPVVFLYLTKDYKRFAIQPSYLYEFFMAYINGFLENTLIVCTAMTCLVAIMIYITAWMRKRVIHG